MRLEIEREALKKEKKVTGKQNKRLDEIEKEVADLKESTSELELKWKNEKETITKIKQLKSALDAMKYEAENAVSVSDLSKAAEIRYSQIPQVEEPLNTIITNEDYYKIPEKFNSPEKIQDSTQFALAFSSIAISTFSAVSSLPFCPHNTSLVFISSVLKCVVNR
jgi:ATP-dependent Clp protease ATP-binding subunit ClpB